MMNGLGLGKANIETRMLAEAINQGPRMLESQKIAIETEAERAAREVRHNNRFLSVFSVE